jgi:hypothetical protein
MALATHSLGHYLHLNPRNSDVAMMLNCEGFMCQVIPSEWVLLKSVPVRQLVFRLDIYIYIYLILLHPHTHLRRDTFSKPHITLYLNWQPHFSKIWPQLDSNISKCLSDKTQCGTSLKIPLGFFKETQLCKIWKSFAFFSRFFQPNLTFQNMKIVCIFPKVFSRKPNLHKTWKPFFFWGFF